MVAFGSRSGFVEDAVFFDRFNEAPPSMSPFTHPIYGPCFSLELPVLTKNLTGDAGLEFIQVFPVFEDIYPGSPFPAERPTTQRPSPDGTTTTREITVEL